MSKPENFYISAWDGSPFSDVMPRKEAAAWLRAFAARIEQGEIVSLYAEPEGVEFVPPPSPGFDR